MISVGFQELLDDVAPGNDITSCIKIDFKTPRLYSQWLNSVIYRLINHCTDWTGAGVTSFGRQFDFLDVYLIRHCNVDIRRRNVILQLLDVQNVRKNTCYSLNKGCWNSESLFKMAESL